MYNIALRLFDFVFMIDGLGDVDDDDGIGFEVGEDENDVVKNVGEEHIFSFTGTCCTCTRPMTGEEDEDSDDDVDVKNDGKDDDVSSLNIESMDAI
ncbi:unnamed protein product [Rotaria sp. Silwood1]|nr:unnamed protein product [Rotaria sp. Silwood1]CAF1642679.1 unnamed protein product [Rotaria sp. Silwood1]